MASISIGPGAIHNLDFLRSEHERKSKSWDDKIDELLAFDPLKNSSVYKNWDREYTIQEIDLDTIDIAPTNLFSNLCFEQNFQSREYFYQEGRAIVGVLI